MLNENDIVRFTVKQTIIASGAEVFNVFYYQAQDIAGVIETPEDYADMISDFMATVMGPVSQIQSSNLDYTSTIFDNLTNNLDQFTSTATSPSTGAVPSASEPSQTALSFKLVRATRLTRNGSKRIGGIAVGLITDPKGQSLVGNAQIVAVENALSQNVDMVLSDDQAVTLVPVIIRKPAVAGPVTVFNFVSDAVYRGVGSQNSRKELL